MDHIASLLHDSKDLAQRSADPGNIPYPYHQPAGRTSHRPAVDDHFHHNHGTYYQNSTLMPVHECTFALDHCSQTTDGCSPHCWTSFRDACATANCPEALALECLDNLCNDSCHATSAGLCIDNCGDASCGMNSQPNCHECSSAHPSSNCNTPNVFSPTGHPSEAPNYWDPNLMQRSSYPPPSAQSPTFPEDHFSQRSPPLTYQNHMGSPESTTAAYSGLSVCQWGVCGGAFTSHADLMAHVNESHLGLPLDSSLSCHWADCTVSLFEDTELKRRSNTDCAMSSTILANHLLRDHLSDPRRGLSNNASSPSEVHSPLSQATSTVDAPFSSQSSSSTMVDAEMSPRVEGFKDVKRRSASPPNHTCQWKGCTENCASAEEVTKHLMAAHIRGGQTKYDCWWGECDRNGPKALSSKQKIMRHLQSHTGHRPFECSECGQHFSEAATLQQHQRRHTSEKPYLCDFGGCDRAFAVAGALTIHKRMHTGEKPFKCTHCTRAFAESSNLAKHLRTHTGEKPYACPVPGCTKKFSRPDQLSRHGSVHSRKQSSPTAISSPTLSSGSHLM